MIRVLCCALCCVLLVSCFSIEKVAFKPQLDFNESVSSDSLRIQFNGVGCFYIEHKGAAVLTDPFLSNPGFVKVTLGKIKSDAKLIAGFKPAPKTENIGFIIIGHAHYDHILDLPYFLPYLKPDAKIIGSYNALEIVKTLKPKQELVLGACGIATAERAGEWIYSTDNNTRVMVIQSAHLPHIGKHCHLFRGRNYKEFKQFPERGKHFKQDETYAFLIDFLDANSTPEKRVYVSTSATAFPAGFFPESVLNEKTVDVAILSVALFQKAKGFPESQINFLQPKTTILCHWENFFRNRSKSLKPVALTHHFALQNLMLQLGSKTRFYFLKPGYSFTTD